MLKNGKCKENTNIFLIAGCHRSGSSLIANIVNHCGIYMGDDLMEPDNANPDGFYEDWDFVKLNNKLLSASEGSWNIKPKLDITKTIFDSEMIEYIKENKKDIWALKDNRLAYTFPAWEPYLENIHWIVAQRHKQAIVNSLFNTHSGLFSEELRTDEYFKQLYNEHYDNLKKFSNKYPTLIISYERLFKNPKKEIKRILEFIGIKRSLKDLINCVNKESKHF